MDELETNDQLPIKMMWMVVREEDQLLGRRILKWYDKTQEAIRLAKNVKIPMVMKLQLLDELRVIMHDYASFLNARKERIRNDATKRQHIETHRRTEAGT